jgi:hypothetical protein
VALAELAFPEFKAKHKKQVEEYEALIGSNSSVDFYASTHHRYRQLIAIMKERKQLERVAQLETKMHKAGWRC